jgi:hypothetical protein
MGWNDSRVSLLAPRWKIGFEENTTGARTADGTPVRIAYMERVGDFESEGINRGAVEQWMEARGFQLQERAEEFTVLRWEDVEALLVVKDGELAGIELTFTLSRHSPSYWASWTSMVRDICKAWGLSLYDSSLGFNVESGEILRVLANTQAWRDLEEGFKWPPAIPARSDGT